MTERRSPRKLVADAWARSAGSERRAVLFLLVLPVVVFVVPALFGHPVVAGDNQIQNYPLRVLSGQMLSAGHLPMWDPWIWSGSPLLGGLNAGSLYPGTWIFAVLPGLVAWTANLVFLYWVAAFGIYVLARMYGLTPLASVLGGASFAFAGSMTAQMVHLGVVQGAAWIPWMVAGELRLAQLFLPGTARRAESGPGAGGPGDHRTSHDHRTRQARTEEPGWRAALPWVLLVGLSGGLVFLVGEPRSMADAAWVCVLCAAWWLILSFRASAVSGSRRIWFVATIAMSGALAIAIGGAQLFPGISFLSTTQRSTASLSYFGSGSLPPRWSVLLLVPDIFGGDGILHQPQYFAGYNLPEVTGYIGILACVGAFTLLARSIGRSRSRDARTWSVWLVILAVGLVLTFGTYSPLGGPLSHIPFYGGLRLQSRNLTIVDLGLAMLLAFWVDTLLRRLEDTADGTAGAGTAGAETSGDGTAGDGTAGAETSGDGTAGDGTAVRAAVPRRSVPWPDVVGLAPAFVAGILCIALLAIPARLETAFGITGDGPASAAGLRPWAALQLVVVLVVIGLVLRWPKLSAQHARRWLLLVVVGDLLLFSVACSTGFVAGRGVPLLPVASQAASLGTGRFAIYDPPVTNLPGLIRVGETDLNALTHHASVQGYGSVVGKTYDDATGTHLDGTLSPCALEGGTFAPFGLRTLLALPASVAPLVAEGLPAAPESAGCGIDWPQPDATSRTWLFESPVEVDEVDLAIGAGESVSSAITPKLRIGVVTTGGQVVWPDVVKRTTSAHGATVEFRTPVAATSLVASGPGAGEISDTTIVIGPETRIALDGPLQDALDKGGWRYAGRLDGFVRYVLDSASRNVWIEGDPTGASVVRISTTIEDGETDRVDTDHPVVVARSEAYAKGWHVEVTNMGDGRTVELPAKAVGLVQGVSLPAGKFEIRWSYWAPGMSLGLASSALGALVLVAGVVVLAWNPRRRRQAAAG
jgi:hypothetical protein